MCPLSPSALSPVCLYIPILSLSLSDEGMSVDIRSVETTSDDNKAKFAGLMGNDSEWYFTGAKLFPNVKGCGYPPMLNCSIFYRQYANIGQNFSCYYSKVDPGIVISDLDMWQVSTIVHLSFFSSFLHVFRVMC